jgi:4-amino-4-deoxy-L-arabinose transferase-like glycosyltransferase
MKVRIDNRHNEETPHKPDRIQVVRHDTPATRDVLITLALIVLALIPRIILARQLDVVTDEIVYIFGGKTDFHLLTHWLIKDNLWSYNYEHPPLVKLIIGLTIFLNKHSGALLSELQVARVPSIIFGSLLISTIYWFGRIPFGRVIALGAALCLAFSPWLVYFSALAYLDMTMTTLITVAYLLLWPAIRRPQLYLLIAGLVALAADSKYTAALAIPGMLLFTLYYFLLLRPRLPQEQQPAIPWRWWLLACVLCPLAFLIADPAIWPRPIPLLLHSFLYEWNHASEGHLTFMAGATSLHMPQWTILYILFAKFSLLVTLPALFFLLFAPVQLVRFHLARTQSGYQEAACYAFLFIWLLSMLLMFSRLTIVVGTHYHLPLAPPLALAGATGLAILLRYFFSPQSPMYVVVARFIALCSFVFKVSGTKRDKSRNYDIHWNEYKKSNNMKNVLIAGVLIAVLVVPHVLGLVTTYGAEGYASEVFGGENTSLQVAYPGYRDGLLWLANHTSAQRSRVGLVGLENALGGGNYGTSWYTYNSDLIARFQLTEVHPDDYNLSYDYLVWPMHLIQRGYTIPPAWQTRVVHTITGGATIYCYILARNPATIT